MKRKTVEIPLSAAWVIAVVLILAATALGVPG